MTQTREEWLAAAGRWRALGFKIFPLAPGEKTPAGWIPEGEHGYKTAVIADDATLWRWIMACSEGLPNIGLSLGPEHVAIDLDIKEIGDELVDGEQWLREVLEQRELTLPEPTLSQRTARAGRHLIYRLPDDHPPVKSANGILPCVDIKGFDGYIAVEPSVFRDKPYTVDDPSLSPVVIPHEILEVLASVRETRRREPGPHVEQTGDNPRRPGEPLEDFVERAKTEGFKLGNRDASFMFLARQLHAHNYTEWNALDIVEDVWRATQQTSDDYFSLAAAQGKVTRTYADKTLNTLHEISEGELAWARSTLKESRNAVLEAERATKELEAGREATGDPMANHATGFIDDVEDEEILWLWKNWIPAGKLTMLAGMPEAGKSSIILDVAAAMSANRNWPDGTPGPGNERTLLMTSEDGVADTVKQRLKAAQAAPRSIIVWQGLKRVIDDSTGEVVTVPPVFPEDIGELRKEIINYRPKLVIIDVLNSYLSGKIDSYRDTDIRRALHPIGSLAEEMNVAIVAVVHLNKGNGSTVLTRINGSMGYVAAARVALVAANDPDDETRQGHTFGVGKSNIGQKPLPLAYHITTVQVPFKDRTTETSMVVWDGESDYTVEQLLVEEHTPQGKIAATEEWLMAQFAVNRELTHNELVGKFIKETGKSEQTLARLARQLGVEKTRVGFGRGSMSVWIYPPREPSSDPALPPGAVNPENPLANL